MKILVVTTSYPRFAGDSVGTFVALLAEGLSARGEEITVLTPAAIGGLAEEQAGGVRIVRVGSPGLAHEPGGILPALAKHPWRVVAVPRMIRALDVAAHRLAPQFDVVHGHWLYPSGWVAVRAAEAAGRPSIVTGHGADLNLGAAVWPLGWLARRVASRATRTVVVSQAMFEAARAVGIPEHRLEILPLGVASLDATQGLDHAAAAFGARDGIRLIAVGSLVRRKGADILLRALAMCSTRNRLSLALIGEGPYRGKLEQLAHALGLTNQVVFVGAVSPARVPHWMDASDIFVLPSRAEGLGLVCVEAMQAGRPVIATAIPGPKELIRHEENGLLVNPEDPQQLARAIDRLAQDPELRVRLGRNGASRVAAEHRTLEASLDRHQELYRRVAQTSEGFSS